MSTTPEPPPETLARQAAVAAVRVAKSPGVKLIVVGGLALFMSLMALFIYGVVSDRTQRAEEVKKDIQSLAGGEMTVLGPMVAIPYSWTDIAGATKSDVVILAPVNGSVDIQANVEQRRRSLFTVPVFQATVKMHASFTGDLQANAAKNISPNARLDTARAQLVFAVSNAHALLEDPQLKLNGTELPLRISDIISRNDGTYFGTAVADLLNSGGASQVDLELKISGSDYASVVPFAGTTRIHAQGNWPDASYSGSYLTSQHASGNRGFSADWFIPAAARMGSEAMGTAGLNTLIDQQVRITFTSPGDPYQATTRALKYAPLFIGLVFLTYFLFEVTSGTQLHPAQYVMVGAAQLVFFLLLLSFAERIGFDWSFLISAVATVTLISLYAGWSFRSAKHRNRAAAIFAIVYAFIYTLLRMEDNALLIGSLVSFAAIAALMYGTRNLQWSGGSNSAS